MPRWTKAHTYAEKLTELLRGGEADFDTVVAVFSEAIDYGRRSERRAALARLQKTYDADGFEGGGSLTSWGAWEVAAEVIKGNIVTGEGN